MPVEEKTAELARLESLADHIEYGDIDTDGASAAPPPAADAPAIPPIRELDQRLAFYPLTDLGNGERFRDRNRGKLIYTEAFGWLYWDGRRWSREGAEQRVLRAAHDCARAIQFEARAISGTELDHQVGGVKLSDKLTAWGRASEATNKLAPMAKHASAYLTVEAKALDANPWMINVSNGTLVVAKNDDGNDPITLKPHDPGDLITKLAPVDYEPNAAAPRFDAFFQRVQKSPLIRAFLFRWMGYSLTGDAGEQKFVIFWGRGRNGKGVFVETCAHVAGDYAEYVPIETFLRQGRGRSGGQATPDLMLLFGARMVRTSEPDKGAAFDEALIKQITGGDPVQARDLNRPYVRFRPCMKLTISGNYQPKIGGADEGIWNRVLLVPWTEYIPPSERDPLLGEKLTREASGILNRLLDGLRDYLDRGLDMPPAVREATERYRSNSDQIGRFLDACTRRDDAGRVQSSVLLELHNAWARANAGTEYKGPGFARALEERGFRRDKSSVVFWLGMRATKTIDDFVGHDGRPLRQADRHDAAPVADEDALS